MVKQDFDYKKTRSELDDILAWFESGEVDIEQAIEKYQKAEVLLKELNDYLADASAKIEKLIKQGK